MIILETLAVGFSMFSALPVPQVEWSEKNMRYSLCVFPLVGAVIAAACCVWTLVCDALSAPDLMRGAGLCLLPVLMTGGIHLDGYADTCDALASRAAPEKRQTILKDPNIEPDAEMLALLAKKGIVREFAHTDGSDGAGT